MNGLVWLRSDIRIDDNPALSLADSECDSIICVYLHAKKEWLDHNNANVKLDFILTYGFGTFWTELEARREAYDPTRGPCSTFLLSTPGDVGRHDWPTSCGREQASVCVSGAGVAVSRHGERSM